VLLTMAVGEFVAPQGEQMARNYRAQQLYGGSHLRQLPQFAIFIPDRGGSIAHAQQTPLVGKAIDT
jgi:lipopolysaccharide export LptBFGC system permease protein LptF